MESRLRPLALILVAAVIAAGSDAALAQGQAEVEGVGLCIVKPIKGVDIRPGGFGRMPGTAVALLVKYPDGGLIDFDRFSSTVHKFVDSNGAALDIDKSPRDVFGWYSRISDNGDGVLLEVRSKDLPSNGSAHIQASGTLVFSRGTEQATVTHKQVALAKGTVLKSDEIDLIIRDATAPKPGEDGTSVAIERKGPLTKLVDVRFLDANGEVIEARSSGGGSSSGQGRILSEHKRYRLTGAHATATIELTVWKDLQTVIVPFDVTVDQDLR